MPSSLPRSRAPTTGAVYSAAAGRSEAQTGVHRSVKGAVNEATQTHAVEWIARAGYPVSGTLHLLVAYLIVRIALGSEGDADQTGALATLANSGGGAVPL